MSRPFRSEELLCLCAALAEGEIDDSQAARLRALLHADPRAREFYLRFMEVHALLHLDYAAGSTPAAMPGGSSMPRASLTEPALRVDGFAASGIAPNPKSSGRRGPRSYSAKALVLAFGSGMAAMLLLVLVASSVLFPFQDRAGGAPGSPDAAPKTAPTPAPTPTSKNTTGGLAPVRRDPAVIAPATATGPAYPLDLTSAYAGLVRASHPIGYWRFTALEAGGFANEIPGAPPLRLTGAAYIEGPVGSNRYLVLPPDHGEPFLETDAVWPLPHTPGHSIEFWFLPLASRHASLVGLLPPRELNPIGQQDHYLHSLLVELTTAQPQSLHKSGAVRLLVRSPIDPLQVANVYSAHAYVPGRWHHVVAQKRGGTAELFVDGILTDGPLPGPGEAPVLGRIVVGRRMPDPGDLNESRAFVGCIDELALYDHPLSPAEIRDHRRAVAASEADR